jgi:hypothetical protein
MVFFFVLGRNRVQVPVQRPMALKYSLFNYVTPVKSRHISSKYVTVAYLHIKHADSGMLRSVALVRTDISVERIAYIRETRISELGS